MYHSFDAALTQALNSEFSLFGTSDRSVATVAARRASAENHVKAMNEATLGKHGFALIHDTASGRYHEDAELMAAGKPPVHHALGFYLKTAEAHRKADDAKARTEQAAEPFIDRSAARAA
jgi:hypothetical protein